MSSERIIPIVNLSQSSLQRRRRRKRQQVCCSIAAAGQCTTFGFRLPTAATSAASYCMPSRCSARTIPSSAGKELLSFEEIERVARSFVQHGVRKIRITGGEPLLRRGVEDLVAMLANIQDVELTLTTNGCCSRAWQRDSGCGPGSGHREPGRTGRCSLQGHERCGLPVSDVLAGIDAAAADRSCPLKINMVVKRGLNDHGILAMARHFRGSGHILRFIEFMDVGASNGWKMDAVVPSREIVELIGTEFPLEPIDPNYEGEVAERWRYLDGAGEIGVISSVTQAFCSSCSRIRLSTEGRLYTCLFAQHGHDLRACCAAVRTTPSLPASSATYGADAATATPRSALPKRPR